METAPYQDYYCNSHNVNTPVCECKYIFTNTWTDLFWGKKSCREVRREKNIPQSIEKVKNIPHSRFLGKKILAEQKTTSPFLAWEQQTYFRSSLLSLRKVIFRRERGVDRTYVCCSQQATPTSKVKWSAAKGRTIRKVMRGEGNFRAAGIFFRYQIPCMNFFQALAWIFLRVNWRARHWREQLWCGCSDLTHLSERRGTTDTLFFFI